MPSTALERLLRCRWAVLALFSAAQWWLVVDHTGDWNYFNEAAHALFGGRIGRLGLPGGLHLYAHFPVQFGPPPILVAELARLSGGHAKTVFGVVAMALCVPTIWLLERASTRLGHRDRRVRLLTLVGGLLVVQAWGVMAFGFTHLDDALVLFGAALALSMVSRRPAWAAVAAGTAVAAKPWGIIAVAVLVGPGVRRPVRTLAIGLLVAGAWWAPFLIDPHNFTNAGHVQIPVTAATPLHLLDPSAGVCPLWVRPVQLLGELAIALTLGRRSPAAAIVVGICLRLLIDPGQYDYYWCGLLVAVFALALLRSNRSGWLLVGVCWLISHDPLAVAAPTVHAILTFAVLAAVTALAIRSAGSCRSLGEICVTPCQSWTSSAAPGQHMILTPYSR